MKFTCGETHISKRKELFGLIRIFVEIVKNIPWKVRIYFKKEKRMNQIEFRSSHYKNQFLNRQSSFTLILDWWEVTIVRDVEHWIGVFLKKKMPIIFKFEYYDQFPPQKHFWRCNISMSSIYFVQFRVRNIIYICQLSSKNESSIVIKISSFLYISAWNFVPYQLRFFLSAEKGNVESKEQTRYFNNFKSSE